MLKAVHLLLVALIFSFCSAQIDLAQTTVNFSPNSTVNAGTSIAIQIQPRDSNGTILSGCPEGQNNPFNAFSTPTAGVTITKQSTCKAGIFPYTVGIAGTVSGNYLVSVYLNTQTNLVGQSPYNITIIPAQIYAQNSRLLGSGTREAVAGEPAYFTLRTYDQYNNYITTCQPNFQNFLVQLFQPGTVTPGQILSCDASTGVYNATYTVTSTEQTFLEVFYLESIFKDIPSPTINPGPPFGPNCEVTGPGVDGTTAGNKTELYLVCFDQFFNLITDCSEDYVDKYHVEFIGTHHNFTAQYQTCLDGQLTFSYNDTVAGVYDSSIYYETLNESSQFPDFTITIVHGPPSTIIAVGPGVENNITNTAGENVYFSMFSSDQYGNFIPDCLDKETWFFNVNPPMENPPNTTYCVGNQTTTFWNTTDARHPYTIDIQYGDLSSIFNPYRAFLYANVLAANTSTIQHSTNEVDAGVEYEFIIDGHDIYNNPINFCNSSVDDSLFNAYIENVDVNTPYTYTANVQCIQLDDEQVSIQGNVVGQKTGRYHLWVYYDGLLLSNAPTTLTVNPGAFDPSTTIAVGTGFFEDTKLPVVAGEAFNFTVYPRDQYENVITSCDQFNGSFSWLVLAGPDPPLNYKVNQTFNDCENGTFFKSLTFYTPANRLWNISVYSVDDRHATVQPINNSGIIELVPGPISPEDSAVAVPATADRGGRVNVVVVARDQYQNDIYTCTPNPLLFRIMAIPPNSSSSTVVADSMNCAGVTGTYENWFGGSFLDTIGTYYVSVTYQNELVGQQTSTLVGYGSFSQAYSFAQGPGVNVPPTTLAAGSIATFDIMSFNQFGYALPARLVPTDWFLISYTGISNPHANVTTIRIASDNTTDSNKIDVWYNATVAQLYSIEITFNSQPIKNSPYNSQVVAGPLDPATLQVSNLTAGDGEGTFLVSGTDRFGNPVPLNGQSEISISLSPECIYQYVSCNTVGSQDDYVCNFKVKQGGIYCINVYSNLTHELYSVPDSKFEVVGGTGCENNCNNNGYCFINPDGNYECNCSQGWTGSDCSDKINKKYMKMGLAIGLIVGLPLLLLILGFVLGCALGRRNRQLNINSVQILRTG